MAEETKFKCSGDCLNCRMNPNERKTQWLYCAAQFTHNSMRMIEALHSEINVMRGTIDELKDKIESIQNNEADVFDPTGNETDTEPVEDTAQEGDGVTE